MDNLKYMIRIYILANLRLAREKAKQSLKEILSIFQ